MNSLEDNFDHLKENRDKKNLTSIAESKAEYERNTYEPGTISPTELKKRVSFY